MNGVTTLKEHPLSTGEKVREQTVPDSAKYWPVVQDRGAFAFGQFLIRDNADFLDMKTQATIAIGGSFYSTVATTISLNGNPVPYPSVLPFGVSAGGHLLTKTNGTFSSFNTSPQTK